MTIKICVFLMLTTFFMSTTEADWKPFISSQKGDAIYEPSGIRQLANGHFILVQDESADPFVMFELYDDKIKKFIRPRLPKKKQAFWILGEKGIPKNLEDLEGLAQGPDDYLYAITSHSKTETSGKKKKSRQKLVRFKIDNHEIHEFSVYNKLRKAIIKAYPELKISSKHSAAKTRMGFNIEGLAFDATGKYLLIGMRGPVLDKDSLILILENPTELFEKDAKPRFAPEMLRLNLNKSGIRAISYIPKLDGYLLVTQKTKKTKKSKKGFHLWYLKDLNGIQPEKVMIEGLDLKKTEGISPVHYQNKDFLMLVSDDGNRANERPAQYLLISMDKLHIPSRE